MYRALSAAVAFGLLCAAPAFADIRGAKCASSDGYIPGGTATMRWTCSNGSPAAPDPEALNQIALGFPDGWTVVSADRSLCAQWEHTIAILDDGPMVLTCSAGMEPPPERFSNLARSL